MPPTMHNAVARTVSCFIAGSFRLVDGKRAALLREKRGPYSVGYLQFADVLRIG